MLHGHPSSYDDAILESGNHVAKVGQRNIFWGGSSEAGATYVMERATGKRDAQGEEIMKPVKSPANASVEVQHLENTFLRQLFAMRRGVREKSASVRATERVKAERYGAQCEAVSEALAKLESAVSECVGVLGGE